jgi:flagellar motility protein MotE (MotC chaperone)
MKPVPRLLPLVAVAIGGVLALKALSDVVAVPQLFAAGARAEEAASPAAKHASLLPAATQLAASAAPASPHACAQSPAELAKAAGLSPGELQTLQNLGARRGQIDDRERMLDTQLQLLAAAETKVDSKMKALTGVKAQIQALLSQADQQQQSEIDRLVIVYQKMKPAQAAAVFATLDDKVRIPVAMKMKEAILAQILGQMPTAEAKKLTESLAHHYSAAQTLSEAAEAPPLDALKEGVAKEAASASAAKLASAAGPDDTAASKSAEGGADDATDAAKPAIKIHMAVRNPPRRKALLAHVKHDTPTQAAARAARPPPRGLVAALPPQTALAKPAPVSSASAITAPPGPKPHAPPTPAPATPTIG